MGEKFRRPPDVGVLRRGLNGVFLIVHVRLSVRDFGDLPDPGLEIARGEPPEHHGAVDEGAG